MIYLIVPPIIIVLAVAILIVFISRVSAQGNGNGIVLTDSNLSTKGREVKRKRKIGFFKKKTGEAAQKIKKTLEKGAEAGAAKVSNNAFVTQGIIMGNNVGKVVKLRKKTMVSDKMNDGEGRDSEEMDLMREIESDPQNSKKYEKLADYYMEHEKFEDAHECYKYVLRLDPRHKRAQVAMKNLDRVL